MTCIAKEKGVKLNKLQHNNNKKKVKFKEKKHNLFYQLVELQFLIQK